MDLEFRGVDNYYQSQKEPNKSCLMALREIILTLDKNITHVLKYGMPFFCYNGKMVCYLWVHKKLKQPYLGIVEGKAIDHPLLIQEKRARMKIMLFNPEKDLPVRTIQSILKKVFNLYKV